MDQTNTTTSSQDPINPITPQPLNTGAAGPTEMPMGVPMQPAGGQGLPADLPATGPVKSSGGSKNMIMMVLVIIVIIALLGAGGYYFWSMQNKNEAPPPSEQTTTPQTDPELEQLKTETDQVDLQDPQADITQVSSEIDLIDATPAASASSSAKPKASP